jgi:hypothetical protein
MNTFLNGDLKKLYQNGESFFFPDSRSDVDARLPVARRQVLNGSGRGFEGFRIRTIRKKI